MGLQVPATEVDGMLSTADVATRLGVSRRQVQRLADEGQLEVVYTDDHRRFWFDRAQVDALAAERRAEADPDLGVPAVQVPPEVSAMVAQAVRAEVEIAIARAVRAESELAAARAEIARLQRAVRALTGE